LQAGWVGTCQTCRFEETILTRSLAADRQTDRERARARQPSLGCALQIISTDSNVACVSEAIACLAKLAKGLRQEFSGGAKVACPVLLDKFKEKNAGVCGACAEALSQMHAYCFTLADVVDDYVAALAHKNPKVRCESLKVMQVRAAGTEACGVTPARDAQPRKRVRWNE
jgi:hypothetical protein